MIREIISIRLLRDFPLALAYCAVCGSALWISNHPVEDWVLTSLIGYVSLWLSRLIIVNLVAFALRRLRDHGLQMVERFGMDVEVSGRLGPIAVTLVVIVALAVVAVILGLALTAAALVIFYSGLTPLPTGFTLAGAAMLGIGAIVLLTFFALSLMLFAGAEAQLNKLGTRVSQIERSEQVVSNLMPASGPARTLDAAA